MTAKDDDYDMIFKVVLIGDSYVGKTNIMSRYLKNEFSFDSKATVGVEFGTKKFEIDGNIIKAQIWDTAGQERYKAITNAYYKGAKGAFLVYDITRRETFDSVDRWIPDLKSQGDNQVMIILLGNKCDLESQRKVAKEEGEEKAKLYDVAFMETSACSSVNISEAFNFLIQEIFKKFHAESDDMPDDVVVINEKGAVDVSRQKSPEEKKCC